jgi:hypothetical protein
MGKKSDGKGTFLSPGDDEGGEQSRSRSLFRLFRRRNKASSKATTLSSETRLGVDEEVLEDQKFPMV